MMNPVSSPTHAAAHAVSSYAAPAEHARRSAASPVQDEVAISKSALDALDQPPIRKELVERIRAEIEAGTYLNDDKLDAVAGKLEQLLKRDTR